VGLVNKIPGEGSIAADDCTEKVKLPRYEWAFSVWFDLQVSLIKRLPW